MKKRISNKNHNSGFIGLLVLLIVVGVIALIIVRTGVFKNFPTGQRSGQNTVESGIDAINSAKNAKNQIESR